MPISKEEARGHIIELVEKYERIKAEGRIKSYNEEMTKKDFILPLFDALGWDVYNKKADEVTAEEKVSKGRVDYALRLNGISKLFVEAKALKVDLDQPKWAKQAINYAWHKGVVWAVLTDFEGIKIFNAEIKSTYPLQGLLFSLSYRQYLERFDQLWLLSRESLELGLLDKEAEKWGKKLKKAPVDKQLLADFTRWRGLLSKDILKLNLSENLTEEQLDESVQRILDRLIFIRSCEDRELEPKVLISDLREWEDRGRGALVKKVREIFRDFDDKYNSELFREHLCDDLEINNEVLKDIISGLYRTQDMTIAYDFSAIDADVLGTIYEQYLGHLLKKTPKRAKLEAKKAHRKEHGIYYTPTYIVDYIVRNTLGELLKDKKVDAENIKILDPACGSGSFLIKSFDVLNEYWAKKDRDYAQTELDIETGAPFTRKVKILKNNVFGVDLDKKAVEIAQLNLLLKIAQKRHRLPLLQQNLKCGNSLIDDPDVAGDKAFKWDDEFKEIMDGGGFDVVVGNPPYVRADVSDENYQKQRKWMDSSGQYETLYEKWDLFIAFIERGLKLLKEGGMFSFIVSNSFNTSKFADKIKRYILDDYYLMQIDFFKDVKVFEGVGVESVILTIKKSKKNGKTRRILHTNSFENTKELRPSDDIKKMFRISAEIYFDDKFEDTELLGDICYVSYGLRPNSDERYWKGEFKKDDLISKVPTEINKKPYVEAKYIERYKINEIRYLEWDTERSPKKLVRPTFPELYILPKIIRGATVDGTYDKSGVVCNHSINVMVKHDDLKSVSNRSIENSIQKWTLKTRKELENISKNFDLRYVLAILNSKFAKFYLNTIRRHRIEYYFYPDDFKILPIKNIPKIKQQQFIKLVDKMLSLNKRLIELKDKRTDEKYKIEEEIKKTDAEIDELVYKLYGITEKEKRIIEESLR